MSRRPPAEERVLIVDDANRPVGAAPRARVRAEGLTHRATYIFVFDPTGRLFVQHRTETKDVYPGYWDLAAGGVVLEGESYDEGARRELAEELGIARRALEHAFDFRYRDADNDVWGRVYRCEFDGEPVLQAEEIAEGAWLELPAVRAGAVAPVTPDTAQALERLLAERERGP